jgi:hypothetical protein
VIGRSHPKPFAGGVGPAAAPVEGKMLRRVLVSGLLGFVALTLWTFVTNAMLGLAVRVEMERIPEERVVYQVLKERIASPGVYLANPALTPEGVFPAGEPVFGIRYAGFGHEAAGRMVFIEIAIALAASLLTAALLFFASDRVLSRYGRRVLFVAAIGLLLAVCADMGRYGIGGHPLHSAVLLAANRIVAWALAGLAIAWQIRPTTDLLTRRPQQRRAA